MRKTHTGSRMPYPDLDEARKHYAALKDIFASRTGAEADPEALRRVEEHCWAATAALDDAYCREEIGIVGDYAAGVFSAGKERRWEQSPLSGTEFLRVQILKALDALHSRVYSIEAIRRAGSQPPSLRSVEARRNSAG
jgi:hypothetical protein